MRLAAALAALLLLASPLVSPGTARGAVPASSCPDILVGDSLAVGMGPYARAAGFEVIARTGIGLAWLRAQSPRCARRVVVVIGTNDLRGIDPYSAEAYPERLAAIMGRWQAQQITWATPGCFSSDASLERGSEALDRALAREPLVRVGSGRGYMRVHSGRPARCSYISGDGIHPSGAGYRAWWATLSQAIGPAPEGERYREARAAPDTYARRHVRTVPQARPLQLARSGPPARSARQAHMVRSVPSSRSMRHAASAPSARSGQPVRAAQPARPARSVRQARSDQAVRPVQQARTTRTAQRPQRDFLRIPAPSRQPTMPPIRRT